MVSKMTMMTAPPPRRPPLLLILAAAILAPTTNNLLNGSNNILLGVADANAMSDDYYCGLTWPHAASHCPKACPTGDDAECSDLGADEDGNPYECFYFTGCKDRAREDDDDDDEEDSSTTAGGGGGTTDDDLAMSSVQNNNFCGRSWVHAMLGCSDSCPNGYECSDPAERCFAATNCDRPLEQLVSELLTTLQGPDTLMEGADRDIFGGTIGEFIAQVAEEEGIALDGIDLGEQTLVSRRELYRRAEHRALLGHDRYLNIELKNITQRMLQTGSSAIDVSMVVTGDYRPPPYLDLDIIAEDSINRNGAKVVKTLRDRGERAGRDFFRRVEGIEAVKKAEVTKRPTRAPIRTPTISPAGDPTSTPSGMPSYSPTSVPSGMPSRALDQVIMTGSREDLMLGGETTSSYGYIFNVRTKADAGVVMMNGFDFYTESTDDVNFEMWSRMGSFQDHKGTYEGWDLIASGTTKGRGIGRYTSIPPDMFTPVSIPGGGGEQGTRAFYLTLDSINLVYKLGERGGMSDEKTHHETEDIEIWEGEGVLFYPFPDPKDKFFYRMPRQYLGAIYYDRLPCKPFSVFGPIADLPCPERPTGSPTLPPPTNSPVPPPTISPSNSPIIEPTAFPTSTPTDSPLEGVTPAPISPTEMPTISPTVSNAPTGNPTTVEPTTSPVVPMRSYIVTTLRNVPMRGMTDREAEKFLEILTVFLQRHTDSHMVLAGVELWHQEIVMMDAAEGYVPVSEERQIGKSNDEEEDGGDEDDSAEADEQSPVIARGVTETGGPQGRSLEWKKKPPEPPIQVHAMEITLVLKISFANLPPELLGNMASVAIEENGQELLNLLHEQKSFYSFFRDTDGAFSRTIMGVSPAPTLSPTTEAYYLQRQAELEAEANGVDMMEEEDSSSFGIFVGLGIGALWCLLTGCSVAYLMNARGEMEEQRDMENLLNAEKANPLDGDGADGEGGGGAKTKLDAAGNVVVDPNADPKDLKKSLRRSSTVPMGNDDSINSTDSSDDSDPFDHSKNTRLAPRVRNELSKSQMARNDLSKSTTSNKSGGIPRVVSGSSLNKLDDEDNQDIAAGSTSNVTSRYAPKRKAASAAGRHTSVIVTSKETKAMLENDAKKRGAAREQDKKRMSVRAGGKDVQRKSISGSFKTELEASSSSKPATPSRGMSREMSQSMVLPKTNIASLEKELDIETEFRSSLKPKGGEQQQGGGRKKGGQRAMAKSMVIGGGMNNVEESLRRGSSGGRAAAKRRSSNKNGDDDLDLPRLDEDDNLNVPSLRKSTLKHGSGNDLAGMRQSTRKPAARKGSFDDPGLRQSTRKGSGGNVADLKRSVRKGSSDNLRKSSRGGDNSFSKSEGEINEPSNRRRSRSRGGDGDLWRSDNEMRKPSSGRRKSGTVAKSMIM